MTFKWLKQYPKWHKSHEGLTFSKTQAGYTQDDVSLPARLSTVLCVPLAGSDVPVPPVSPAVSLTVLTCMQGQRLLRPQ